MASSDNLLTMEPWLLRPQFAAPWVSDPFRSDPFLKALQKSISGQPDNPPNTNLSFLVSENPTFQTHSISASQAVSGGSENETAGSRKKTAGGPSGTITKRKSRAKRTNTTTYITADAANFRQMVQQVTGGGMMFAGPTGQLPVLKPEPHRAVTRLLQPGQGGCLPTLDTSAFFLDRNYQLLQQNQQFFVGQVPSFQEQTDGMAAQPVAPPQTAVDDGGNDGFDFESLCSFPTLESWRGM